VAHPGRCILLRLDIGQTLPVFVLDEYEGFDVMRFVDLTDTELERYLSTNVEAVAPSRRVGATDQGGRGIGCGDKGDLYCRTR